MKILIPKHIGFCNGVTSAVKAALNAKSVDGKRIFCLGEIVHNESVNNQLKQREIKIVDDLSGLTAGDTLIVRSHGASPSVFEFCKREGVEIIDATCPFVKNIQNKAKEYFEKGYQIVLIGDERHPEIVGINGWCQNSALIFNGEEKIDLKTEKNVLVLFQTTFDNKKVEKTLKNIIASHSKILEFFNTICYTTKDRQQYADYVSLHSDFCVVIGGKNSSNTSKLYECALTNNKNTIWIQSAQQLPNLSKYKCISLIAGASTPSELTEEVLSKMLKDAKDNAEVIVQQPEQTIEVSPEEAAKAQQPEQTENIALNKAEEVVAQPQQAVVEDEVVSESQTEQQEGVEVEKKRPETEKELFTRTVDKLEKSPRQFRKGQKVKGEVVLKNDEGVYVSLGTKKEAIIPNDQLSADGDNETVKQSLNIGDKVECIVISTDKGITLSKKEIDILYKDDEQVVDIKEGKEFEVAIKQEVKGGLLARLGSYMVFVPASHIKMGFARDLSQYVGKKMTLIALPDGVDENKHKIVASHRLILERDKKEKEDNFWDNIEVGEIVEGKVLRFASFGAFVSVRGVDCLAHLSDLAWTSIKTPDEVLEIGKTYEFVVLKLDRETNRISIGYKQLQPHPWQVAAEKYTQGTVVKGKVARILPYGAFIDLGDGIDGLLHISNMSWDWLADINQVVKVNDEIEVQVMECDPENKRITLSRKALLQQPEADSAQENEEQPQSEATEEEKAESPAENVETALVEEPIQAEKAE